MKNKNIFCLCDFLVIYTDIYVERKEVHGDV